MHEFAPQLLPVSGPWITQLEIDYVNDAVRRCWYENANEYHDRFETAMADYVGQRHAISLPSCTSAIHLALAALGVGTGDEVIVPEITWIASAAPIHYVGADPVMVDIDASTWCLSLDALKRRCSPRTKAIVAVDLYGNTPAMDDIMDFAGRHGISVIEDAAEAFGSRYRGRMAGSLGDVGVFSFHGSKTATTGEGGMLVTNDSRLYERVQFLRDHGRRPGDNRFLHAEIGFKYKMSAMQAALGLAQVERADELVQRKREIFSWYRDCLKNVPGIRMNSPDPDTLSTYWMVTILFDPQLGLEKAEVARELADGGVDTRPLFHPLSALPAFTGSQPSKVGRHENPIAYGLAPYGINLPSGFNMTPELVDYVSECVRRLIRRATARRAG